MDDRRNVDADLVRRCKEMMGGGASLREAASRFGISTSCASKIKCGRYDYLLSGEGDSDDMGPHILRYAEELASLPVHWIVFYREIFGKDGLIAQHYDGKQRDWFDSTDTNEDLLRMLFRLRVQNAPIATGDESCRVITIRVPKSLHAALRDEAHRKSASMNQLCVSKLIPPISKNRVPEEQ